MAAEDESFGLVQDVRNTLRVTLACDSRRSHYWAIYLGSDEKRPAIKWSLKVWMALLEKSRR